MYLIEDKFDVVVAAPSGVLPVNAFNTVLVSSKLKRTGSFYIS